MRHVWLNKRLYEALPFAYMAAGAVLLIVSLYFFDSMWAALLAVVGLASVTGGLVVLLRRRGYRASRSREAFDELR